MRGQYVPAFVHLYYNHLKHQKLLPDPSKKDTPVKGASWNADRIWPYFHAPLTVQKRGFHVLHPFDLSGVQDGWSNPTLTDLAGIGSPFQVRENGED